MAKGVPGSGHTQYHLNQVRKDTKPMASKYTAGAGQQKASAKQHTGGKVQGGKKGSC